MANITLTYWGLTGVKDTVTVDDAVLVDGLITAIATDEGLDTNYYVISKLDDPSKSSYYYSDSSTTIDTIGIIASSVILCTPNQTGNKEQRQIQKLDIAQIKRQAGADTSKIYYRSGNVYDLTALPTKYTGNAVTDNANSGGLIVGRPWTTGAVTALFVSLGAEFEIRVDDTSGISPGMIMTGADYSGTVTVVTVISSTSLEMSIIAPDTVPAPGTVLTFTNP